MRFFKRLRVEASSFFEADKQEEEEINLNRLAVIFLLGLLLLFGSYFLFFDTSKTVYNLPVNAYNSVKSVFINTYNSIKSVSINTYNSIRYSIKTSGIGEEVTIGPYKTIPCKTCKINTEFTTEQDKKTLILDYELSHKNYLWRQVHKILERTFSLPVDFGWVQIIKELDHVDWSKYNLISLSVKGTGKLSNLEFSIIESDGDAWYYFDKTSLASKDWTEIRMPFEDFVNPEWASHGDGKKEFKDVTQIRITITNFDKTIENTLYFGTFDGEIFKLV